MKRTLEKILAGLMTMPVALGWMAGCATVTIPRHADRGGGMGARGLGESHSVVLADVSMGGWESGRRDASMNARGEATAWDQQAWPEPDRASLDDYRRLYLSDRPGVVYFPSRRTGYVRPGVYFVDRCWR